MRNIVQVRRAFQVTARRKEEPPDGVGIATLNKKVKPWEEEETFWEEVERTGSDEEDQGGEEGLTATANAQAKSGLKMRRSFELVMKTGQVVRYEVSGGELTYVRLSEHPCRHILDDSHWSGSRPCVSLLCTGESAITLTPERKWSLLKLDGRVSHLICMPMQMKATRRLRSHLLIPMHQRQG